MRKKKLKYGRRPNESTNIRMGWNIRSKRMEILEKQKKSRKYYN